MDENKSYQNPSTGGGTSGSASNVRQQVSDRTTHLRDNVVEMGSAAAEKIEEMRSTAAQGLENAASKLDENADNLPGGERVGGIARAAADRLSDTADYVREKDFTRLTNDVGRLIKSHPGPAMAVAAVVGFMVGRSFSNE